MRHDGDAAGVERRRQVEVVGVLAVRVRRRCRSAVRVLQRRRTIGQGAVDLGGVGAGVELVARVLVGEQADVVAQILGELTLVAAVQIDLGRGIATRVLDPLDARRPGAHVETAHAVVDTGLHSGIQAALRNAAVAVVGGHGPR